jgi:hypothetical protein
LAPAKNAAYAKSFSAFSSASFFSVARRSSLARRAASGSVLVDGALLGDASFVSPLADVPASAGRVAKNLVVASEPLKKSTHSRRSASVLTLNTYDRDLARTVMVNSKLLAGADTVAPVSDQKQRNS